MLSYNEKGMGRKMYALEILIFITCMCLTCYFLYKWYRRISLIWKPRKLKINKYLFGFLPLICLIIIYIFLKFLASFDVVNSPFYILFYIFLGFVWLFLGDKLLFFSFDLSLIDDAFNNINKAASFSIFGGMVGLTLIYAGANIGDGPGFWCVLVAGGLGVLLWIIFIKIINKFTYVIETVTVSRDIACGIRFGSFLIASAILFARASGGDWISFSQTIVEFKDGWTVLPLGLIYILIEKYYYDKAKKESFSNSLSGSIGWSIWFIVVAILLVIFVVPPFNENPIYNILLKR